VAIWACTPGTTHVIPASRKKINSRKQLGRTEAVPRSGTEQQALVLPLAVFTENSHLDKVNLAIHLQKPNHCTHLVQICRDKAAAPRETVIGESNLEKITTNPIINN